MTAVARPLPVRPPRPRPSRPARPGARRRASGAVRVRRRRAVAMLVALVLLGVGWAVGDVGGTPLTSPRRAPAADLLPVAETSYVVRPGDTLWGIARALVPSGDVRPLVQRLAAQRRGAPLRVGERLVLPPAGTGPRGAG